MFSLKNSDRGPCGRSQKPWLGFGVDRVRSQKLPVFSLKNSDRVARGRSQNPGGGLVLIVCALKNPGGGFGILTFQGRRSFQG